MSIKTAYSSKSNLNDIVNDIKKQLDSKNIKMVLYFASSSFSPDEISKTMNDTFSDSIVFGCSTAGEIFSGKMLKNSVIAMAFDSETIEDVKIEVVANISSENNVPSAFKSFESYYKTPMNTIDYKKHFGIILIDGLRQAEEKIMDCMGNLTNVQFIGGCAADDLQFKQTFVYANGKAYTNAALLALIKPKTQFDFIKTQSFNPLNKKLIPTKVNEAQRQVFEFNNKPAFSEYASALGKTKEEALKTFIKHPLGLIIDDNIFVRSPLRIENEDMFFACNLLHGMELTLLETTGKIVEDTKKIINDKIKEIGQISAIINFNCAWRLLELMEDNQVEDYVQVFKDIPTIGFNTYGEEFIGHINQTATMIVFK